MAERRLSEAAMTGNAPLLEEYPEVRALYGRNNPIHIAAQFGHIDIVRDISQRNRELTSALDSEGKTPLHVASAEGHVEVVRVLLAVNSDACFVHDGDGRTPLHAAAVKGKVEVLEVLYNFQQPRRIVAWALTDKREPILHLCVNHDQFDAMKKLIELVKEKEYEQMREFVNMKDDCGNTILHLLTEKNEYKVIKYLLTTGTEVDFNARNVNGWTAFDVSRKTQTGFDRWKIMGILRSVGAKSGRKITPRRQLPKQASTVGNEDYQTWLSRMKEALLVVATLLATITFQAGLNPPGGTYQDDENGHTAGTAIMSYLNGYKWFTSFNTLGLFASVTLILLLVSGLSLKRKISIHLLIYITWIAVGSILGSYFCSFAILTQSDVIFKRRFWLVVPLAIFCWIVLMCAVLGAHIFMGVRLVLYKLGIIHFFQMAMRFVRNKVCCQSDSNIHTGAAVRVDVP